VDNPKNQFVDIKKMILLEKVRVLFLFLKGLDNDIWFFFHLQRAIIVEITDFVWIWA
jgi:hypothetical protein